MPENTFKIVAFDCDGVMFDTKQANEAFYNAILAHLGLPAMTPAQSEYAHMHTVDQVISHLITDPRMRIEADRFRAQMTYEPFMKLMEIEPFLKPLLEKIHPDLKTAIATNRTNTIGRVLIDHNLENHFDLVVSASDVENPKPFPDQLEKILTFFNAASHEMLYIGDSKLDELAATAAKVPFAAFDNKKLNADYHIKSLKEVEAILRI